MSLLVGGLISLPAPVGALDQALRSSVSSPVTASEARDGALRRDDRVPAAARVTTNDKRSSVGGEEAKRLAELSQESTTAASSGIVLDQMRLAPRVEPTSAGGSAYFNCNSALSGLYGGRRFSYCIHDWGTPGAPTGSESISSNNVFTEDTWDACGELVWSVRQTGLHSPETPDLLYTNALLGNAHTVPTGGVCFGAWTVGFTLTGDGVDASMYASFPVYASGAPVCSTPCIWALDRRFRATRRPRSESSSLNS